MAHIWYRYVSCGTCHSRRVIIQVVVRITVLVCVYLCVRVCVCVKYMLIECIFGGWLKVCWRVEICVAERTNFQLCVRMLYCHLQHHNYTINKQTQEDFFINICTSHFIVRVRKGLLKVCVERELEIEQKLQYFDPHSYGRQHCLFLVLLMLNRRPCGPALYWMMAFFTTSYQQLLWSPNSIGVPKGPFGWVWLSLPHLVYNFFSNWN